MYGNARTDNGIVPMTRFADALAKYENTKHIRGRDTEQRPLGVRTKSHFQIRKAGDSIACKCYYSDVVVYNPDNTIDLHVPKQWRSNTTARFIGEVLGYHRATTQVHDNDIIVGIKGRDARYLRAGENVKFRVEDDGQLTMLSNDRNHKVHSVNRTKMNAVRKKVAAFRKYMQGNLKLREGIFHLSEEDMLDGLLSEIGVYSGKIEIKDGWRERGNWTLDMPMPNHWMFSTERAEAWLARAKKFIELASNPDNSDYHRAVLWLAASNVGYTVRGDQVRVSLSAVDKMLTDLLIATHIDVLEEKEEPRDRIIRDSYARFNPYKETK